MGPSQGPLLEMGIEEYVVAKKLPLTVLGPAMVRCLKSL